MFPKDLGMARSVSLHFVSLLCGIMMLPGAHPVAVHAAEGDANSTGIGTAPAWETGVSAWNGSGYEIPTPVRGYQPSSQMTGSGLPYTMPVDPTVNTGSDLNLDYDQPSGNLPNSFTPLTNPDTSLTGPAMQLTDSEPLPNFATTSPGNESAPWLGEATPTPSAELTVESLPTPTPAADLPVSPAVSAEEIPPPAPETWTSPDAIESPPLEEEVVRWYNYPRRWMRGWDSHAEFGLDGSNGNADTLALQTGLELKRKSERSTLGIDVDYRQASSRNVTVEDNGRFNLDYDYLFAESPWSGFAKYGMEWDKFKAFDLRLNLNGGIGYFWIRDDTTTLVTRFGAGASQELGAPIDDWIPEAVFGLEAERQLTSRQKIKGKVDYFPAWEDFEDYRLVTDLSWEILLDGSDNLSLKLAATDRYDSTPQGARPNDLYYSLLLLYKF
jgi:putative salt-induced outer membrane protein YdiY